MVNGPSLSCRGLWRSWTGFSHKSRDNSVCLQTLSVALINCLVSFCRALLCFLLIFLCNSNCLNLLGLSVCWFWTFEAVSQNIFFFFLKKGENVAASQTVTFIYLFLTIWTVWGNLFHSFRNIMNIIALYLDCDLLLKCWGEKHDHFSLLWRRESRHCKRWIITDRAHRCCLL